MKPMSLVAVAMITAVWFATHAPVASAAVTVPIRTAQFNATGAPLAVTPVRHYRAPHYSRSYYRAYLPYYGYRPYYQPYVYGPYGYGYAPYYSPFVTPYAAGYRFPGAY
jgi:hypothetical protein